MASDLLGGAALGAVFSDLQTAILDVVHTTASFKPNLRRLQATILSIKPMFDDVEKLGTVLNRPESEKAMFVDRMKDGTQLILKCSKIKRWNLCKKYVYSKKLTEFDESLVRFFQIDVQAAQSMYISQIMLTVNTGAAV